MPVLFTDRDLGKKFPEILRDADLTVERHADHFAPDCADEIWLAEVGKRGWIAVTHDGRILPSHTMSAPSSTAPDAESHPSGTIPR